jgi:hypothetical protein
MMASVNYFLNRFKKEDFMVCIYIYKIHDWNIWLYFTLRINIRKLSDYRHVQRKTYQEFYHSIVHITNDGCHIRIHSNIFLTMTLQIISTDYTMYIAFTATCTTHKAHEKYLTKAYVYEISFKKLSILFSSFL